MAIVVDQDTRLVVQGLTGSEGRFHGLRNRDYGTQRRRRRHPGKGRPGRRGHPGLRHGRGGRRAGRREHVADLRARALCRRRRLRGGRRRHRHRDRDHRAHPRARDAPRLHVRAPEGDHDDRAELPGVPLARQGERRDHPGGGLRARARSGSSRAPARSRTRSATSWPSSGSATRRSSGSAATRCRARRSSTSSRSSRPTRRPSWS